MHMFIPGFYIYKYIEVIKFFSNAFNLPTCTKNPTVGAMAMRRACGRITWRSFSVKESAKESQASHCPLGMDSTQPRQISTKNALV